MLRDPRAQAPLGSLPEMTEFTPRPEGVPALGVVQVMPIKRPCSWPGCRTLVAVGTIHCNPHARQAEAFRKTRKTGSDKRRAGRNSRDWYRRSAWRDRRERQLAKEPLCRMCIARGRHVAASVADHVEPHREDFRRFWEGELQSLCASCHSSTKQAEERAEGRRREIEDVERRAMGARIDPPGGGGRGSGPTRKG